MKKIILEEYIVIIIITENICIEYVYRYKNKV